MSNQNQRPMYFSQIRVDPVNDQKVFVGGNPGQIPSTAARPGRRSPARTPITTPSGSIRRIRASSSSATTAASISATTAASTWDYHNDIAVGQFYQVSADMRRPYYVCGGLQDNNAWCGPSALRSTTGPREYRLVHGGRRRRLLHPPGPHRLGHRLRRIAGRQHEPPRYARRHAEEHPSDTAAAAAAQRRRPPAKSGARHDNSACRRGTAARRPMPA